MQLLQFPETTLWKQTAAFYRRHRDRLRIIILTAMLMLFTAFSLPTLGVLLVIGTLCALVVSIVALPPVWQFLLTQFSQGGNHGEERDDTPGEVSGADDADGT